MIQKHMISLFQSKQEKIGVLLCLCTAVIMGLYPPMAKLAYDEGANIAFVVLLTTFMRFIALYGFAKWQRQKLFQTKRDVKLGFSAGFFQACSIIGILGATYFIPGSIVIIIMFTYSLMLLFFSAWRGVYKLNKANIFLTFIALFGLAMVLDFFNQEITLNLIGIGLAIMSAFATFARIYIFGIHDKGKSPAVIGAETFMIAVIVLGLLSLWQTPIAPETAYGWMMASLSGLSLAIGSFGIFYGVALLGAYRFSMIAKLEPIFTALFGLLLLSEVLSVVQYVGMIVVIISLLSLQIFDKQK